MKLKELQEKRNKLAGKIAELRDAFNAQGKKWQDDEQRQTWDQVNADFDAVTKEMDEVRAAEDVERRAKEVDDLNRRSVNERRGIPGRDDSGRTPESRDGRPSASEDRTTAIAAWFKRQAGIPLSQDEREACKRTGLNPARKNLDLALSPTQRYQAMQAEFRDMHPALHKRAMNIAGEGAVIPEGFVPRLERAMLAFGPMLQVAEVLTTATGNDLPWPTANDTGNTGALLAEETTIGSSVDPTVSAVTLGAYKFSSKPVLISHELLEDSAFDLSSVIASMLGERLGRVLNTYCTTGTGTAQPNGIVTASAVGKTTTGATAITGDELIDLQHSVDPAYRSNPGVAWMMHDNILAYIRKLKDTSAGNYLWQPGLSLGIADRLLGHPIRINQDMQSTVATATKTVLFGDLEKYKIRQVKGVRFVRLVERYADTDQEAFIAFLRADGDLLDAGVDPVKHLLQA